ncbi:unnamed protein product [Camellia sinensis]
MTQKCSNQDLRPELKDTMTDRSESEPQEGPWHLHNLNRRGTKTCQSKDRSESEAQEFLWHLHNLNRRATKSNGRKTRDYESSYQKQWKKN